jgi:formylmethanofuran dehydrogenase subunit C
MRIVYNYNSGKSKPSSARMHKAKSSINRMFRHYKPEKGEYRELVVEDAVAKKMKEIFCDFNNNDPKKGSGKDLYDYGLELVKQMSESVSYSSKDITSFVLSLEEFQESQAQGRSRVRMGLFLSALINNCKDKEFTIFTGQLSKKNYYIGYKNTKNILVEGDAGEYSGHKMGSGTLIIKGNSIFYVGGEMKGGNIVVKGNAGDYVGYRTEGGTITIEGNTGHQIGYEMRGGTIHLNGDYGLGTFGHDMKGGNIYHKGKLIVENGKVLI